MLTRRSHHALGCISLVSLATVLLASSVYQLEAQHLIPSSHDSGVSLIESIGRKLTQRVDPNATTAPDCNDEGSAYCLQENACLPGSYSLDTTPYCACCRPRGPVDPRVYTCGFVTCNENTYNKPLALPSPLAPSYCSNKWMTCPSCPAGTYSPAGSDSPYDCKSFLSTTPTCYLLKNFSNPDVRPFPGMYFWPLNYTALNLQRLDSGPCAGHGLPVQVCLGSNHWSGPNATLYQMWFIMEDGTRLSPYKTAGTNRGNYVIGFMPTSNSTCKWAQRNSLFYRDGPNFEISGTERCLFQSTLFNGTSPNTRRFKFMAPPQPYCTPNLVVV